jgi:hypothetical protein
MPAEFHSITAIGGLRGVDARHWLALIESGPGREAEVPAKSGWRKRREKARQPLELAHSRSSERG